MKKNEISNNNIIIELPKELRNVYEELLEDFSSVLDEWSKKNIYSEIRIGHKLDKKILDFLITFTDYMTINHKKLNAKLWSEFLSTFPLKFYYGLSGDDFNYIYDDELGNIFLTELNDFEKVISMKKLNLINKKFKKLRKELD